MIDTEILARMRQEYEAGKTLQQLADKYRIGVSAVFYRLRRVGTKMRRTGGQHFFQDKYLPLLREAYEAGATLKKLAAAHGTTEATVHRALRRAGCNMRPAGLPPGFCKDHYPSIKIKRHMRAEIVALRQGGLTLREIGEKYGVTRERIRQILKEGNK